MSDEISSKLVKAALALAAMRGWRGLTLADIAAEAGVALTDVYRAAPTKYALLTALARRGDAAVAAALDEADPEDGVKDRLFDALMARFDDLLPEKDGAVAVWRDCRRDPVAIAHILKPYADAMAWTLAAAGVSTEGPRGLLRIQTLARIWRGCFIVWVDDDEGQAKTMAELDQRLSRAASVFEVSGRKAKARSNDFAPREDVKAENDNEADIPSPDGGDWGPNPNHG